MKNIRLIQAEVINEKARNIATKIYNEIMNAPDTTEYGITRDGRVVNRLTRQPVRNTVPGDAITALEKMLGSTVAPAPAGYQTFHDALMRHRHLRKLLREGQDYIKVVGKTARDKAIYATPSEPYDILTVTDPGPTKIFEDKIPLPVRKPRKTVTRKKRVDETFIATTPRRNIQRKSLRKQIYEDEDVEDIVVDEVEETPKTSRGPRGRLQEGTGHVIVKSARVKSGRFVFKPATWK
jgi:hypothetical protein